MQVSGSRIAAEVALMTLLLFTLGADNRNRVWQYGEIVSIKEDVFADGDSTAYVYSLRAKDTTYLVAFASPLKASIHSKVKFAVEKKSLCVQDVDGKSRSAAIVEQAGNTPHR
jgi:hypothetical protein